MRINIQWENEGEGNGERRSSFSFVYKIASCLGGLRKEVRGKKKGEGALNLSLIWQGGDSVSLLLFPSFFPRGGRGNKHISKSKEGENLVLSSACPSNDYR